MGDRYTYIAAVDFETYYDDDYTLRKMSTTEYIRDPRFRVHCFAARILPLEPTTQGVASPDIEEALNEIDWSCTALLAHHAHFDGLILSHHYGIHPCYFLDTLSMARPLHGGAVRNDLDSVARHYHVGNKLGGVLALTKGIRDLPSPLLRKLIRYNIRDVNVMLAIYGKMVKKYPQNELDLIDITVRAYTKPVIKVNKALAQKCLTVERRNRSRKVNKVASKALALYDKLPKLPRNERIVKAIRSNIVFARLLEDLGVDPPTKISPKTEKEAFAFAQSDMDFKELEIHEDRRVRELYEARKICSSSIEETRSARLLSHADPALPIYLNYGKAHTFRWTGGDKLGPQNFPRLGDLRRCLTAPRGHKFVIVDSGQIEARVNAWMAKEEKLLIRFRKSDAGLDKDPYCYMADEIYGQDNITKKDKLKRFVGKTVELGAGYGMGPPKFRYTMALGAQGPSVVLSEDESKEIIYNVYRGNREKIVTQWATMDRMLRTLSGDKGAPKEVKYGPCMYRRSTVELPNGMFLRYPRMYFKLLDDEGEELARPGYLYFSENSWRKIYGGMLTENVVQALARIIVADQALRIYRKYHIVLLVHDEVVLCVPTRQAKKALAELLEAMSTPLEWCKDLPVIAEGAIGDYYLKP